MSIRTGPPKPARAERGADVSRGAAAGRVLAQLRAYRARAATAALVALAAAGLFLAYLRLSRTMPTTADGSSNAVQAWDMLHGNVLLHGWTVSDVSFYTTELPQYALVELVVGYHADVVHVAAAMTYTLLVALAALLAKGRATGVSGAVRMAVAVALMLAPEPGAGAETVLSSPDHTGTGVPLLFTWLVLDRALTGRDGRAHDRARRWLPFAMAALLAWGQIADPLVTYIGALPLVLVSAWRLVRSSQRGAQRWYGLDARLLAAGALSPLLAHGFLAAVRHAGGFYAHPAALLLTPLSQLADRVSITGDLIAVIFGGYLPQMQGPLAVGWGLLHLVGVPVVLGAFAVVVFRALRRPLPQDDKSENVGRPAGRTGGRDGNPMTGGRDRVAEILAVAIAVNLGAYVVSMLPSDLLGAREIIGVLPMGAALAGRIVGPRLGSVRLRAALVAVLVVFSGALVTSAAVPSVPAASQDAAQWLESQHLTYGIGSYWGANSVTLTTGGRVQVAPLIGSGPILAYRWESRADWYDPARHDARFLILDLQDATYGSMEPAIAQFGPPAAEPRYFGRFAVLLYDHNLLVGLSALCGPDVAPSMAQCR